jgi:hypothetical protein
MDTASPSFRGVPGSGGDRNDSSVVLMDEHPIFRMWRDRLDEEVVQEEARAARRAVREAERAGWYEAWLAYKEHLTDRRDVVALPRWWNLLGWARYLLRLHSPGRPN